MKKPKDPCKGCIWAERIFEGLIFCPFHHCVKGKSRTGQLKGKQDGRAGEKSAGG